MNGEDLGTNTTPQAAEMEAQGTPEAQTAVPDAAAPASLDAGAQSAEDGTAAPEFGIQVDLVTGERKIVQMAQDAPAEDVPAQEAQAATPPAYTSDELIQAMTYGQVDESRIPDNLKANYIALRQQQQIAAMQAQQLAVQQAQTPSVQPEPPAPDMTAMYQRMREVAEAKAMQDLGIDPGELESIEYSDDDAAQQKAQAYKIAVDMNLQQLARRVDEYQQQAVTQQAETQAAMQELVPRYQQMISSEPNFAQIDVMMGEHYKSLPYAEAMQVRDTIARFNAGQLTRADIPVLETYYKKTREAFYAKQQGLSRTPQPAMPPARAQPPQVEGAGRVTAAPQKEVDWRSMRNMDTRQRSAFLRAHLS